MSGAAGATSGCTVTGDGRPENGKAMLDENREEQAIPRGVGGGAGHAEDRLREELRELNDRLLENQRGRTSDKEEMDARMQDIKQKAKDHFKQLQEKMQQVVRHKDLQLQELEAARAEMASQVALCESRSGDAATAASRTDRLSQECDALKAQLLACEERESRLSASQDTSDSRREAADLRHAEEALRAELREQAKLAADARREREMARQESEAKIADVVRKAKDHVKQVQTRLESSLGVNRELTEKHNQVDEAYKQQQEKVTKYKQLMFQANARIEESDERVRELSDALGKSQSKNSVLQKQMGSMQSSRVPPNREEILRSGGILLAVEAETDDVWCLINDASERGKGSGDDGGEGGNAECKNHWWLLSQLDVEEKPIPIQRRWKGEVSALRAQMLRFKKKSEDLQEEFDGYRQKAGVALQTGAAQSQEIQAKERQVEQLGEQLQAMAQNFQQAQTELTKTLEDLCETRKNLQEVSLQRSELKRTLESCQQDGRRQVESAVESCTSQFESQREALERQWLEKERTYQQELDLRRAQKESLDEEVEGLRARLATRLESAASQFSAAQFETDSVTTGVSLSHADELPPKPQAREPVGAFEDADNEVLPSQKSSPRTVSSVAEPAAETRAGLEQAPAGPSETPRRQPLPTQAYSLHASVAWQDLVSLRSQVRQLELSLQEERQQHGSARKENDLVKSEIREMNMQQRLQNTVDQHQHMEYIRNVFRKFVETLPSGHKEHEQLIPVLMTFFKFPEDELRAIQGKRLQNRAHGSWNPLAGWRS
mmetsp:Transcript_62286/g.175589  ORF Transcript_62286/g.175589 Transcript_62286/m.175589 type:complete len:779 (-) Transcript_62286:44-2380(-)